MLESLKKPIFRVVLLLMFYLFVDREDLNQWYNELISTIWSCPVLSFKIFLVLEMRKLPKGGGEGKWLIWSVISLLVLNQYNTVILTAVLCGPVRNWMCI